LTGLTPSPENEMQYIGLKQEFSLFRGGSAEFYTSYVHSNPRYTLTKDDVNSNNISFGVAFDYSLIRQRAETLNVRAALDTQDAETNILGAPLVRDHIRAFRLGLNYQREDFLDGQESVNAVISQGLPFLGASPADQANLSRAGATPDFTKLAVYASRVQHLGEYWGLLTAVSGQLASGPLYSTEQFGYGGQTFGRAYDNSEIIGDQGVEGSVELGYNGVAPLALHLPEGALAKDGWKTYHVQTVAYTFYDIGEIWNSGQHPAVPSESGSSAGMGFRLKSDLGFSTNAGFAFPLTRRIDAPVSGNGKSPRYFMSLSYDF
jgi:hemolysin activation/secretion protein